VAAGRKKPTITKRKKEKMSSTEEVKGKITDNKARRLGRRRGKKKRAIRQKWVCVRDAKKGKERMILKKKEKHHLWRMSGAC